MLKKKKKKRHVMIFLFNKNLNMPKVRGVYKPLFFLSFWKRMWWIPKFIRTWKWMQAIIYFLKEKKKIGKRRYIFRCMYKQLFFLKGQKCIYPSIFFWKKNFPYFCFHFLRKEKKNFINTLITIPKRCFFMFTGFFFKKKNIYLLYLHVYYLFYHFSYCTPSTICIIYITKKKEKKKKN